MKTLNLISTRWVLIMAFALIGSATLFTACQQEIDSSVDDRSGYQFLRTETAKDLKDWKKVFEGNKAELKDKDIKLEIMPSQAVTTINVNARWSGRLITQFKNTRAWQTRVVEVLANQLTGSETHIDVHSWSSVKTTYYVKVYVRDSNGGGNPPPTGSSFNCSHNPLAFPGSFTIGIEGAQPVNNNNGSNNMTITTQVEGKNRYQHIDESGANFVRLNFFRPNNFSQNDYSWLNTYDNIVCEFASRGIAIYGLVTDVVAGDGGPDNYPTSNPGAQLHQCL